MNLDVARRRLFQQDGCLRFILHVRTQAEQAGCGIEDAAHAAGARAVDVFLQHLRNDTGAILGKALADVGVAPEFVQHGCRHAPGLARGLVAAGQRQRSQLADALELRTFDA